LRRSLALRLAGECQLEQRGGWSAVRCGALEGRVALLEGRVTVAVRGPEEAGKAAFFFLEEILGIIDQVLVEMSPGMPVDKHILSPGRLGRGAGGGAAICRPGQAMAALQVTQLPCTAHWFRAGTCYTVLVEMIFNQSRR
jgi:hypothetical protein